MADRNMDREDKLLNELFAPDSIADNGFTKRVMRRVRRQIWVDRLALPVAAILGFAVAINPLMEIASVLPSLASIVPFDLPRVESLPAVDTQTLVFGALVLIAGLFATQLAED